MSIVGISKNYYQSILFDGGHRKRRVHSNCRPFWFWKNHREFLTGTGTSDSSATSISFSSSSLSDFRTSTDWMASFYMPFCLLRHHRRPFPVRHLPFLRPFPVKNRGQFPHGSPCPHIPADSCPGTFPSGNPQLQKSGQTGSNFGRGKLPLLVFLEFGRSGGQKRVWQFLV